jgi:hypothetical protein
MPNNQNIPKVRAKGSPYADNYGATDSDGNPVANVVRKQRATPPVRRAVSPNEKAGAVQPTMAESTRAETHDAFRLIYSSPTEVRKAEKALNFYAVTKTKRAPVVACYDRRHKLVGFTRQSAFSKVRKAKGDPQIACYDQNGTLLGLVDPADLNAVVSATPGQSAAGSTDTDRGTGMTVGDPDAQSVVAKAQRKRMFRWDPAGRQRVAKQRTAPPVRIIAHGGRRGR